MISKLEWDSACVVGISEPLVDSWCIDGLALPLDGVLGSEFFMPYVLWVLKSLK